MCKKTNIVFRQNILNVVDTIANVTQSHGENIMSDYSHWLRSKIAAGNLTGALADTLGNAFQILAYMRVHTNNQTVMSPSFRQASESAMINIDFAQNRINTLTKAITNSDVLGSTTGDTVNPLS